MRVDLHKFKIIGILCLFFVLSIALVGCDFSNGSDNGPVTGFKNIEVNIPDEAGVLEYEAEVLAESDIDYLEIETSEDNVIAETENKEEIFTGQIKADPGTKENVNTEEIIFKLKTEEEVLTETKESYVRLHDVYERSDSIEFGAIYWPYTGHDAGNRYQGVFWDERTVGEPVIGEYYLEPDNFDHHKLNRHIDQMQSAGISRFILNAFQQSDDEFRIENIKDTELFEEMKFEIQYDIQKVFEFDRVNELEEDLEYIREEIFTLDNYNKTFA